MRILNAVVRDPRTALRTILLLCVLLTSASNLATAQVFQTNTSFRQELGRVSVPIAFAPPRVCGFPVGAPSTLNLRPKGFIVIDTCAHKIGVWNGSTWVEISGGSMTETDPVYSAAFNISTPFNGQYLVYDSITGKWVNTYLGSNFDLTTPINGLTVSNYGGVTIVDSTLLWRSAADARYLQSESDPVWLSEKSSYATTSNLALKLNISDTATMLSPYLRSAIAAATYATSANLALKLNISDTASMLTNYLRSAAAAATYASLTGSYSNPSWITALAWSKITGAPSFLTSYTETDPVYSASSWPGTTNNSTNWNTAYTHANSFNITTPLNGQYLVYETASGKWKNQYMGNDFDLTSATNGLTVSNYGSVVTAANTLMWRAAADARYLQSFTETDPVYSASAAAGIVAGDISSWNAKQAALVSGTNIKTINGSSILGSGDLTVTGGSGMADPGANGIVARTALNTTVARTITGTTNRLTVTNGDGVSANPTIDVVSTPNATASRIMERDANANTQVNTVIQNVTTTATAAGTTTLTVSSSPIQNFTGTTTQTIVLPDATTLANGTTFEIINATSPKVLTVNYNGGTLADVVLQQSKYKFTLTDNGTAAGTWFISTELQEGSMRKAKFELRPAASTVAPTVMGNNINTSATMSNTVPSNTNPWTSIYKKRFQTSTTAGNASGVRTGAISFFPTNAAGIGGFKATFTAGQNLNLNGGQLIMGFSNTVAALAGDPSALTNMVAIGYDAADASTGNFLLMHNDASGTATKVDLGATNAARTTDIGFYVTMTVPPNSSTWYIKIVNLATGAEVYNSSISTNTPAANTSLGVNFQIRNGAIAAAANLEIGMIEIQPF